MNKLSFIFAGILAFACAVPAQEVFSSKRWGIEIALSKFWKSRDKEAYLSNTNEVKLSEAALKKILDGDKGSTFIASYYFHEPGRPMSLHPQVVISANRKAPGDFQVFKKDIVKSSASLNSVFPGIVISKPEEVYISGIRSIFFIGTFTMTGANEQVIKARSRIYSIPLNNYFFQLTMNDGQDATTDFSAEFDEILKSVKIAR